MSVALSSPTPRKQRIIEIASEMVATKVERGELDPNDAGAMDAACREAVLDAKTLYDAAVEYIS
ncbi:hypothetical protein RBI07_36140 (plasmid) [Pseudomonas aeruginosa]|uniref:hypothetical protein n=1 Tax=Pseudomonas aeruginosa TaxID=287 RepID=UPI0027DE5822|nr:hypothetical protein [Pseudomonas aeruginosa]WMI79454.1 hypothetical protein RBI07_36140 [Pseudomonas aeruginosa]